MKRSKMPRKTSQDMNTLLDNMFQKITGWVRKVPLGIFALTIIASTTATFLGIVYNYINSKVLVIQAGCLMVIIMGLLFVRWKQVWAMVRASRMIQLMLLLALVSVMATLTSIDPTLSLYSHFERGTGLLFLLIVMGASLVVGMLITTREQLRTYVLYPMAISGGILGFFTWIGVSGLGISSWVILGSSSGGGGTMGNSSFAGTMFIFSFFVAGCLFLTESRAAYKKVLLGILALVLVNPVMISIAWFKPLAGTILGFIGDARGATISLLVGIAVAGLVYVIYSGNRMMRKSAQVLLCVIVLGIVATVGLLMVPGSRVHDYFVATTGEARFIYWGMALQQVADYPILGTGPETFRYAHERFYTADLIARGEPWADKVHNVYLEQLLTTGVIGFGVYMALLVVLVVTLYRHGSSAHDKQERVFAATMIGLVVAYGLNNIILFDTMSSLFWFWVLVVVSAWVTEWKPEGVIGLGTTDKKITRSAGDRVVTGMVVVAIAVGGYVMVHGQYTKLSLVWDELFAKPPARTEYYATGEHASPYGAAISFAQRADDYSQQYLRQVTTYSTGADAAKDVALRDILEINRVLISGMDRYVPNMQSYLALGNLAIAYLEISGKRDQSWIGQLQIAHNGLQSVAPAHPRADYFETQLQAYESSGTPQRKK